MHTSHILWLNFFDFSRVLKMLSEQNKKKLGKKKKNLVY